MTIGIFSFKFKYNLVFLGLLKDETFVSALFSYATNKIENK